MRYQLTPIMQNSAKSLLAHFGFDDDDAISAIRHELLEYEDAIACCSLDFDCPLLDDVEKYYQYEEQALFSKVLRERLRSVLAAAESYEPNEFYDRLWDGDVLASEEDIDVFSGELAISAFKEKTFTIDYKKFGFSSFEECVFVTGAYIINRSCDYDKAGFYWCAEHPDGHNVMNRYERMVHGDFRLAQYDLSPRDTLSPFGDHISFGRQSCKMLAGYHSVECGFLAIILRYAIEVRVKPSVYENYDAFLAGLMGAGQAMGNFADAGLKSSFIETSLLSCEIPSLGSGRWSAHQLHKESDSCYSAFRDGDDLVFMPNKMRFTMADIDPLISGLHDYCRTGACRTTVVNLVDFFQAISPEEQALLSA